MRPLDCRKDYRGKGHCTKIYSAKISGRRHGFRRRARVQPCRKTVLNTIGFSRWGTLFKAPRPNTLLNSQTPSTQGATALTGGETGTSGAKPLRISVGRGKPSGAKIRLLQDGRANLDEGHGFSRATHTGTDEGFSPRGTSFQSLQRILKPWKEMTSLCRSRKAYLSG